ncbi:hypothetical protein O0Q50_22155 [Priestia aryabhattai]|uniref:TrbC/VIRB2 family protein n=1 Tax=Priestia aryabhattai TaxID=412384 RepID=A0AAX6NDM3_PRIAR|nr:hypothetical protein [Priestia aryabhattai]MDU9693887.1 hypothetical protein [Priestia aryabhattai]
MIINKLKFIIFGVLNTFILFVSSPLFVLADSSSEAANAKLKAAVETQIVEVMDAWIKIGLATMLLPIIAGGALMMMAGANIKLATSGKSLVLGSGITILLLSSAYAIIRIFLGIFGL